MPGEAKTDLVYCLRMLEAIGKIEVYSRNFDDPFEFFEVAEQRNFNASLLLLLHIGEQVNRLSNSLKQATPQVPWQQIKAFRNIVAHEYIGVDRLVVFETIKKYLPKLGSDIAAIIRESVRVGIFDQEEYQLSKDSAYYRHIHFSSIL